MNVGVIGNGLIGKERVKALVELKHKGYPIDKVYVYDKYADPVYVDPCVFFVDHPHEIAAEQAKLYIFAVPHFALKEAVEELADFGEDETVLIEKPLGRTLKEAIEIKGLLGNAKTYIGFNYRFYDGIRQLIYDIRNKRFGDIVSVNMTLAHGGSPEDKDGWKLDPVHGAISSLLDPGIHFLDLLDVIFPKINPVSGRYWKGFWNTGVQEEVHLLLQADKTIINLQTSLDRWKSSFKIEVNGTEEYGVVEGKGRSYGKQTYKTGRRWGWKDTGLAQSETEESYPLYDCSESFTRELGGLFYCTDANCTVDQALTTMKLYEKCLKVIKC
jgi:predicted dehydrogenase